MHAINCFYRGGGNRRWCVFLVLLAYLITAQAQAGKTIVSLDLCTDWMLLKYARKDQRIFYSPLLYRYPNEWVERNKPQHDGSLEQIVKLQPDLILSGEYNAVLLRKRLRQLDMPVEVLALPNSLLAIAKGVQQFKRLVPTNAALKNFAAMPQYPRKHKTLLLLGPNGIGTGHKTLENDILQQAGWDNYITQNGFIRLDLERMVQHPPDAVLWSVAKTQALSNLFAEHRALRGILSRQSPLAASWRWQCPGPWMRDLIDQLAQWKND